MTTGDDDERARIATAPTEDGSAQTQPRGEGPIVIQRHTIGRFRIDAELGSGGMADVYRAHDPLLDRAVALKVLHARKSDADTQGMRRVLREARAAAALTHPNTVTIFEVGEAEPDVFIAMELLEGRTLREVLEHGSATLADKLRWLLEAARALAAAHERGLVHRDVKPENMFVCDSGILKLLDFGIAKRDDEDGDHADSDPLGPSSLRTHAGRRLGTPRYMAPEQHAGHATDARTDEYAWGLVAFELLCGSHVTSVQATVTAEGEIAPDGAASALRRAELLAKVPELPRSVAACIARALEPRKEDRFPSMAAIVATLETKTAPVPALVVDPVVASRAGRWWLVSVLTAATLLLIAGGLRLRRAARAAKPLADAAPVLAAGTCRVVSTRQREAPTSDSVIALPTDALVYLRHPARGPAVEREANGAFVSMLRAPELLSLMRFDRFEGHGTLFDGKPSLYFAGQTAIPHNVTGNTALFVINNDGNMWNISLGANVRATSFTTFGADIITFFTAAYPTDRIHDPPAGASLHLLTEKKVRVVEAGSETNAPAVAATDEHLGVAYLNHERTRFALLDRQLDLVGVPVDAPQTKGPKWLAFAGEQPILYWLDAHAARTRLARAAYDPTTRTFAAAETATDDAVVTGSPLTTRLPDGTFVLAWVRPLGSALTLRIAPIGPGGVLGKISDLASAVAFHELRVTRLPAGLVFVWGDGLGATTIADVVCQPPTSLPDR